MGEESIHYWKQRFDLGKTQYRINKEGFKFFCLFVFNLDLLLSFGTLKTRGRSGFVDIFTFKLHKTKPVSSQCGYGFWFYLCVEAE